MKPRKADGITTFKIDQFVSKIKAPIVCKADGKELSFASGEELAAHDFDKYYLIDSVEIEDGKAVLMLRERSIPMINSIGEELVAGEDWIREHKERFGMEPNMFDGA